MGSKFSYKNKNTLFVFILSITLISVMLIGNLDIFKKKYPIPQASNENVIEEVFQEVFQEPTTYLEKSESIFVHIDGEVNKPGVVELKFGNRLHEAVELAGGLTSHANTLGVNLAQEVSDGFQYIIPSQGEQLIINGLIEGSVIAMGVSNTKSTYDTEGKMNINLGSKEDFIKLPGIGEVLSQRILDYREEKGGFKSIEDLKNVSGIGDKKYEDIKDKIFISS